MKKQTKNVIFTVAIVAIAFLVIGAIVFYLHYEMIEKPDSFADNVNEQFDFPPDWRLLNYKTNVVGIADGGWYRATIYIFNPDWNEIKTTRYHFNLETEEIVFPETDDQEINLKEYWT